MSKTAQVVATAIAAGSFSGAQASPSTAYATPTPIYACLHSPRAKEAVTTHELTTGLTLACVIEGEGVGKAKIISCSSDAVELEICITGALPNRTQIDLVVAYSRPQTIKKILHLASSLGLRSLSFVKTKNVVPSYLQSKSLHPENIRKHLILGCEQSGDGNFPMTNFYANIGEFLHSELATMGSSKRYFGKVQKQASSHLAGHGAVLFLGPESGFTEDEEGSLVSSGFEPISLGPRQLRLELAAGILIGKLI